MIAFKGLFAIIAFGLWLWTQKLLGSQASCEPNKIQDFILNKTKSWNDYLQSSPSIVRFLLITSSLIVDALGLYLVLNGIFGTTVQPLLGLVLLFTLRQICQALNRLPLPEGIIWRDPKFPSLFVTYNVSNDLFFSGHTALAVFGALNFAAGQSWIIIILALIVILYEILVVIALRAHWTMDILTGILAALWVDQVSAKLSPWVDGWLTSF